MSDIYLTEVAAVKRQNTFMSATYGWMAAGLAISAVSALAVVMIRPLTSLILGNAFVPLGLFVLEFVLVISLMAKIRNMSVQSAKAHFIGYSVVNGLTLSSIFFVYRLGTIFHAFFVAAIIFGFAAIYGMRTKKNLVSFAHYLTMALVGILVTSLLNFFLRSSTISWLIDFAAVAIFTGLAAFDAQKILRFSKEAGSGDDYKKLSIVAALELYLDFINIFLHLLRIFGRSKD